MGGRSSFLYLRAIAAAVMSMACMPSIADLDEGPLRSSFAVSDVYTPSGYMGDGKHFGQIVGTTNQGCKKRPPGARGDCYAFTYYPNRVDEEPWAGVYWLFPANSWGSSPGHAIDITRFKQVRFYAAVETPLPFMYDGGRQGNLSAFVGSIGEDAQHPDGVRATMPGGIVGADVTTELKQFHIRLTDFDKGKGCIDPALAPPGAPVADCVKIKDADGQEIPVANDLVGGFGWSIPYPTDTVGCADGTEACKVGRTHSSQYTEVRPVKIYLDDIVWDTEPPP